jgi:hypothetical protein
VTRQVVNVGALQAAEKRTFTLSVEVLPPQAPPVTAKPTSSTGTFKSPVSQPTATVRPSTPSTPAAGTVPTSGTPSPGAPVNPAPKQGTAGPATKPGTPGQPPAGSQGQAKPGEPASPATPSNPASGYVLKPPSPGGPKRH